MLEYIQAPHAATLRCSLYIKRGRSHSVTNCNNSWLDFLLPIGILCPVETNETETPSHRTPELRLRQALSDRIVPGRKIRRLDYLLHLVATIGLDCNASCSAFGGFQ